LERIEIHYPGEPLPFGLKKYSVFVKNVSPELRKMRSIINSYASEFLSSKISASDIRATCKIAIEEENIYFHMPTRIRQFNWVIHSGSFSGLEDTQRRLQQVQWGGVAALLSSNDDQADLKIEGTAYCFLPLPIKTGLPVHLNGYFSLTSNRREIWTSNTELSGFGKDKADWNNILLSGCLVKLYVELLENQFKTIHPTDPYHLWPDITVIPPPFDQLVVGLVQTIVEEKKKFFWDAYLNQFCSLDQALFDDDLSLQTLGPEIRKILAGLGLHIINPPKSIIQTLKAGKAEITFVSPALVARTIKKAKNVQLDVVQCEELLKYIK